MQKVRILFWGDAVVSTGFSRVLHSITKFLPSDKFDISWIGVNYYGDPHEYPYRIYPASLKGDIYGLNRMEEILTRENPEVIFLLNDAWIINPILAKLKEFYKARPKPRVIAYVPVDAEEHDSEWYQNFDFVDKVVAYTEFGKREILKAREDLRDKITVIPHGIDSSQFFKFDLPKSEAKKLVFPDNPEFTEGFVVLNAN